MIDEIQTIHTAISSSNQNLAQEDLETWKAKNKAVIVTAISIDLSKNKLESFSLSFLKSLEDIFLSSNKLKEIRLANLPKLKTLDLSFNKFETFPNILKNVQTLQVLYLNSNSITEINYHNFQNLQCLRILDLSRNLITFKSLNDFSALIAGFGTFKNFESLSFMYNPFTLDKIYKNYYCKYIENTCMSLNSINTVSIKGNVRKAIWAEEVLQAMKKIEKEGEGANGDLQIFYQALEMQIHSGELDTQELTHIMKEYLAKTPQHEQDNSHSYSKVPSSLKRPEDSLKAKFQTIINSINYNKLSEYEFILNDDESDTFFRLMSLIETSTETNDTLQDFALVLCVEFAKIKKGKWAKKCFSVLLHIISTNESLNERLDNILYEAFQKEFQEFGKSCEAYAVMLSENSNKSWLEILETDAVKTYQLFQKYHRVIRHVRCFIQEKFKKISEIVFKAILPLFKKEYNTSAGTKIIKIISAEKINDVILFKNYKSLVVYSVFHNSIHLILNFLKIRKFMKDNTIGFDILIPILVSFANVWGNNYSNILTPIRDNMSMAEKVMETSYKEFTLNMKNEDADVISCQSVDQLYKTKVQAVNEIGERQKKDYTKRFISLFLSIVKISNWIIKQNDSHHNLNILLDEKNEDLWHMLIRGKEHRNSLYEYFNEKKYLLTDPSMPIEEIIRNNEFIGELFKLCINIAAIQPNKYLDSLLWIMIAYFHENGIYQKRTANVMLPNSNSIQVDFHCDPFLIYIFNYSFRIILTNYKRIWKDNYKQLIDLMNTELCQILAIPIQIIRVDKNENNIYYKSAYNISLAYENKGRGITKTTMTKEITDPKSKLKQEKTEVTVSFGNVAYPILNENNNKYIQKLVSSIIQLVTFFGETVNSTQANEEKKFCDVISKLNENLNNLSRDTILLQCLQMDNPEIKTRVVLSFIHVDFQQIGSGEMKELLKILKTTNWIDYHMEDILAKTFLYVFNLFHYNFDKNTKLPFENSHVVDLALRVLEKNLQRAYIPGALKTSFERLNISIIYLLINLSGYDQYVRVFDDVKYAAIIKSILICEQKNIGDKLFPLEIEKCYTMWNVTHIADIVNTRSVNFLSGYNYVSLRLLIHLADTIENIPYNTLEVENIEFLDIKEKDKSDAMKSLSKYICNRIKEININSIAEILYQESNRQTVNILHIFRLGMDAMNNYIWKLYDNETKRIVQQYFSPSLKKLIAKIYENYTKGQVYPRSSNFEVYFSDLKENIFNKILFSLQQDYQNPEFTRTQIQQVYHKIGSDSGVDKFFLQTFKHITEKILKKFFSSGLYKRIITKICNEVKYKVIFECKTKSEIDLNKLFIENNTHTIDESELLIDKIKLNEKERIYREKASWKFFYHQVKRTKRQIEELNRNVNDYIVVNTDYDFAKIHLDFVDNFMIFLGWLTAENTNVEEEEDAGFDRFVWGGEWLPKTTVGSAGSVRYDVGKIIKGNYGVQDSSIKKLCMFIYRISPTRLQSEKTVIKSQEFDLRSKDFQNDPYEQDMIRNRSQESVRNPQMRSLFISAFLRCIFGILRLKNKKEQTAFSMTNIEDQLIKAQNKMISMLKNITIFKQIYIMVQTTFNFCNAYGKFLQILVKVFKSSLTKDNVLEVDINIQMLTVTLIRQILTILTNSFPVGKPLVGVIPAGAEYLELVRGVTKIFCVFASTFNQGVIVNKDIGDVNVYIKNIIAPIEMIDVLLTALIAQCESEMVDIRNLGEMEMEYGMRKEYETVSYSKLTMSVQKVISCYLEQFPEKELLVMGKIFKMMYTQKKMIRKTLIQDIIDEKFYDNVRRRIITNKGIIHYVNKCILFAKKSYDVKLMFVWENLLMFHKIESIDTDQKISPDAIEPDFIFDLQQLQQAFIPEFPNRIYLSFGSRGSISLLLEKPVKMYDFWKLIKERTCVNFLHCARIFPLDEQQNKFKLSKRCVIASTNKDSSLLDIFSIDVKFIKSPRILAFNLQSRVMRIIKEDYDKLAKIEYSEENLTRKVGVYKGCYMEECIVDLKSLTQIIYAAPNKISLIQGVASTTFFFIDDYSFFTCKALLMSIAYKQRTIQRFEHSEMVKKEQLEFVEESMIK